MGEVIKLGIVTKLDISAADMLTEIASQKPKNAFVICWPEDGSMPTYHSSTGDMPVILMRLNEFIHKFYNREFD
jgi:hypothetical protein